MYFKESIFTLSLTLLLTGCGGGGASSSTETADSNQINTPATSVQAKKTAIHQGQVKDSQTGRGVADVNVTIGNASTLTDKNGYYTLSSLAASQDAVVTFQKRGYLLGSTHIQLQSSEEKDTLPNYLEYAISPYEYQVNIPSTKEVKSTHIYLNASTYNDAAGNAFEGTVSVKLTILDPEKKGFLSAFPGLFKGIDTNGVTKQFQSFGLITLLCKDTHGNALMLKEGETATLRFISVSLKEKPETLPLWYYDDAQGLWVEEGYGQLQDDGSYLGEISHFGTWSLNKPLEEEAGIYRGRIVDEEGSPISHVRLQAMGTNWTSNDLSTDEDGIFEIEVIPGSSFQLTAYDYKNKFGASYNGVIPAIASGDVVEN